MGGGVNVVGRDSREEGKAGNGLRITCFTRTGRGAGVKDVQDDDGGRSPCDSHSSGPKEGTINYLQQVCTSRESSRMSFPIRSLCHEVEPPKSLIGFGVLIPEAPVSHPSL